MVGRSTESMVEQRDSPLQVSRFKLVVVDGPDLGATLTSDSDRVVIGTHESAGLVLKDATVSRFHCELLAATDRVTLRDLDSKNGTTVDDVSVGSARLVPGSVIGLGRTRIRFQLVDQAVPLPLSSRFDVGVMVGQSLAMRHVFALVERAAASDASVLLEGETGTGKEAAAESIHRESARRDGPFLVLDCGAIPRDLLESELFGHEKGAFSGAVAARTGVFEAANGHRRPRLGAVGAPGRDRESLLSELTVRASSVAEIPASMLVVVTLTTTELREFEHGRADEPVPVPLVRCAAVIRSPATARSPAAGRSISSTAM